MLLQVADLDLAGDTNEFGAQVEGGLHAVEAFENLDQRGRHEEGGVRVMIRIANEKAGARGIGRGLKIQVESKSGENNGHASFYEARRTAGRRRAAGRVRPETGGRACGPETRGGRGRCHAAQCPGRCRVWANHENRSRRWAGGRVLRRAGGNAPAAPASVRSDKSRGRSIRRLSAGPTGGAPPRATMTSG